MLDNSGLWNCKGLDELHMVDSPLWSWGCDMWFDDRQFIAKTFLPINKVILIVLYILYFIHPFRIQYFNWQRYRGPLSMMRLLPSCQEVQLYNWCFVCDIATKLHYSYCYRIIIITVYILRRYQCIYSIFIHPIFKTKLNIIYWQRF